MQRISWNHFVALLRYCNMQSTQDTPNFWLANQIFHDNLCVYAFMYYDISFLMYCHICFTFYHYINHWFIQLLCIILYNECSEDMTGEYSSVKYQWSNWGGTLGAIVLPSREMLPFSKGIQKRNFPLTRHYILEIKNNLNLYCSLIFFLNQQTYWSKICQSALQPGQFFYFLVN